MLKKAGGKNLYYKLKESLIEKNGNLIFTNSYDEKAVEMSGEDVLILKPIINMLTGTISTSSLNEFFPEVKKGEIDRILKFLADEGFLEVTDKIHSHITLITDTVPSYYLKKLAENPLIKELCVINDLSNISVKTDLIVGIDYDDNIDYFKKVDRKSLDLGIPWIKVSLKQPYIYIGPTFFPDGGPCYDCLLTRIQNNRDMQVDNTLFNVIYPVEAYIQSIVLPEIIKFTKAPFPLSTFETEIQIDMINYELSSYKVLRNPFCEKCYLKR